MPLKSIAPMPVTAVVKTWTPSNQMVMVWRERSTNCSIVW